MKRFFAFLSVLSLLIIESLLTFSCEVGLGPSVDVSAPSVVISSPRDSAVIRGEFALMGTWSDDGTLDKINVVLNSTSNPSLKYEFSGEFTGNAQDEQKNWRCVINPLSETKPIKDGEYKATVYTIDTAKHTTILTKTFTVDNTAPVIILQRPGTASDSENADSYGQKFTLQGQGADSSNINRIDIHIYSDKDCLNFLKTVSLNNVPLNIALDVASFKEDAYTAIYGSSEKNGAKQLYCKIDAYDSAQKYPTEFGKNQSAEDTKGNKTSSYYLYDKLAADILSKYNIARLYEMMNGTYTLSGSDGDGQTPQQIMESVKAVLQNRAIKTGTFTLNPENNPKFTLNGKDALKSESLDISNEAQGYFITNGSDVTVEVSPGLDGTLIENTAEKPLKVYAVECNAQGSILSGAKKIYPAFANVNPNISKSGSTYKIYINLDAETAFSEDHSKTLKIGKMYLLGVEGTDLNGNEIIPSASKGYGFYLASSGRAPQLKITSPTDSIIYLKGGSDFTVTGYTTASEGIPTVEIFVGDAATPAWQKAFTEAEGAEDNGKKKYTFTATVSSSAFDQINEKDYLITIKSRIGDKGTNLTKTVWYDLHEPVIDFTNISPVIENYEFANAADKTAANDNINGDGTFKRPFINGKVRFRGTVQDSLTKVTSVEWHVIQDNVTIANIGGTIGTSFDFELDTTVPGITDNKNITVSFVATDSAGNKTTVNKQYFVCQNTDKPVAGPNNPNAWTASAQQPKQIRDGTFGVHTNKLSAGSSIYAKVIDDDGIKKVEFKVEKLTYDSNYENCAVDPDQSAVPAEIKAETLTDLGSPVETIVNHVMPSFSGYFKVTIKVTDTNDVSCAKSFVVYMTGAAPDVTVTNKSDYIKTGGDIQLEVRMIGEAPFTVVVLQDDGNPNWHEDAPITVNSADLVANAKTITVTQIHSPHSQKIKVRVTDNSSGVTTKEVSYRVDNTPPTAPVIESPAAGSVGNNSLSGTTFIFSGKANDAVAPSANETSSGIKKLYYAFMTSDVVPPDNSPLWNSQAATSGTWNINATLQSGTGTSSGTTLYEGRYWLYIKSEDGAGNKSTAVVKREFTVDQTSPAITEVKLNTTEALTAGTVKYFNSALGDFTISGKVNDTYGIQSLTVNSNNVSPIASDGSWSYTINRTENALVNLSVVAKDNAGRETKQDYSIFCDTEKPALSITNPDSDLTGEKSLSVSNYTFRGSVNDSGSGVQSFKYKISQEVHTADNDIVTSAEAGTNWETVTTSSFSVPKELIEGTTAQTGKIHEGKWYLYLYAKDRTGATSVKKCIFWVDKKSPTLTLTEIPSTTNQPVVVKGTASDANEIKDVAVKITPKPAHWTADTKSFTAAEFAAGETFTVGAGNNLPDNTYTIEVTATDNAGKTVTQTRTVLVDTTAPNGTVSVLGTADYTDGDKNWYKKESIKVKFVPATDSGSEIAEVMAKLRKTGDTNESGTEELVKKTSGGNTWWEGTLPASAQGKNEIYLFIKDKAGNESKKKSPETPSVYIDSEGADECDVYKYVADNTNYESATAITGSSTINGKIEKTFVIKAQDKDDNGADTYSGVKSVYFKYGSGDSEKVTATVLKAANHTYKITIPANTPLTQYQKTGTVKFYIEDNVGNISRSATFSFVLDETAPTVQVNPVTDAWTQENGDTTSNIDVNGILNLSGTASDGYKVQSVSLKYFVGTSEPANWDLITTTSTVNGTTSWTSSIDTTASGMDTKNLYIKAFAQDEAGNIGKSGTMKVYINQDSDRPVITFSNIDLSKSTIWLKGVKNAYGSVFDDDGEITSFKYKNGSGGTWTDISVSNNSWNKDMTEGENNLYFRIVDKKGKVFETGTGTEPKLKSINGGTTTFKNGILTIKVDTTSPSYSDLKFASKKTDGTTSSYTLDASSLVLGGDYKKLLANLKASDQNGVASVTAVLGGTTYNAEIEGANSTAKDANKKDSAPHLWTFPEITVPDLLTGATIMRLVITDQAGTSREDNINLHIDNEKPVLSFTSHSDGATVFATAANTVRGSVDSTDLAEWKYALTNNQTAPAVVNSSYKPLINGPTSFTLVFDGGTSTASETHDEKLFKQICTLESKTETQLQSDDTIRDLYLHIYGKDTSGNISDIKTLHLKAIPNGDKPTVSFSYPSAAGASLGGIIRVTGTSAIQDSAVDAVYIQIDPKPNLTWEKSANGTHYLNGSVYKKYTGSRYKLESGNYTPDTNGTYVLINSIYSLASDVLYLLKNADFDAANWQSHLTTAENGTTRYTRQTVNYTGGNEQAIKANGSVSSWNITLNAYNELNNSNAVVLRIFAVSKTHKKSDYRTIWFKMDPDAPQIGSTIPLELVQYKDDDITKPIVARRNYESNMWIKGKWYLRGSVTDDSGIKSIKFKDGNSPVVDIVQITDAPNNIGSITTTAPYKNYVTKGAQHGSNFDYELNIPVGSDEADKFGTLTYEISATEGSAQSLGAKQTIVLNYDNKAPEFEATTSEVLNKSTWADKLTTKLPPSGTIIKNSAGTYGFYGIVDESGSQSGNQSGFNRVAMFYTRTRADSKTYIIDPMRKGGTTGLENFIEISPSNFETHTSVQNHGDGLYWLKGRQFTVSGNNILTAVDTSTALHASIRKGGLVKVDGTIYVIDSVDTAAKKITVKGSMPDATVDAYFAVCQVIDNFTQENGTTKAYDAATPLPASTNDDGDQMIEGIIESGTMCTWKAFIDSKLILDGDVKLHFVAFDKAGNAVEKEYDANVKNNAPRLYGVKYGTDVNSNGTIEDDEYIKTFNDKYSAVVSGTTYYGYSGSTDNPIYSITATESLTVKATLKVVPRVVGGNLGLGYTYTYKPDPALTATTTTSFKDYTSEGHSTDLRPDNLGIEIEQKFFIQHIKDGEQNITFKLWDKTDGTTVGSTSNYAEIEIPVKVAVQDAEAPTAVLKPFKWISASENSLYANSKKNGHIELEADLPTPTFTAGGTGVYDKDPKISGIVTFEGSVKDNVVVKEINIKIPNYNGGNAFAIATRNAAGVLISTNMLTLSNVAPIKTYDDYKFSGAGAKDWYFEKIKDEYAADGSNTVEFKFHFDSQKISGFAQTDVGIAISAKDRGKASLSPLNSIVYTANSSTPGTTQTTAATNTGYYKVDIVPYITEVKTGLSGKKKNNPSVYSRTAKGHYPVNGGKPNNAPDATMGAETITLEGFNLGTTTSINASTLTSGAYTHTVNGVESLNNKNNNDSKGEYTKTVAAGNKVGDYEIYRNYYNRSPNNDNNNNLTDDVIFDVWQFNNRAARPISGVIENPTMKINPSNGMLGFAFTNGPLYFSMPGKTDWHAGGSISSYPQDYSYVYWQGSFDFMTSVTLHYDSAGKTYATAAGGDINATSADKFSLMTDRWGVSGAATGGSYGGARANRIEMIAQAGDYSYSNADINFDKQRVKSPAIASSRDASSTNLYMAYFDNLNDEIRFKYGNLEDSKTYKVDFGNFKDSYRHGTVTNGGNANSGKYYNEHVQVIAHTHGGSTSLGNPGEYVSLGVVKNGASDVVVLVWYDSTDSVLRYTYNTTPTTVRNGLSKAGWSTPQTIFTDAGEYCQIATDAGGGIHIAAYDGTNGDLKYAYLSSYNSAYTEATNSVIVDSYAIAGQNISIDIKTVGTTYVPYISYYALSSAKPKLAYRTATSVGDGAISEVYTGDWEVTIIPTSSRTPQDRISVGAVTNAATGNSTLGQYYGKCYANGTYNTVLGYQIRDSSTSGFIETAQMK
ncbi:MAG: hypothetical protein ACTTHU_01130 [Treponema sp.]